jgi:hypothetical protein
MPNHERARHLSEKEKDEEDFYKLNSQIDNILKQRYCCRAIKNEKNEKILYIEKRWL